MSRCRRVEWFILLVTLFSLVNSQDEVHRYSGDIPTYIEPITYSIRLKVNLRDYVYTGRTQVLINITESCNQIPIHSNGLNISEVFVATFNNMQFGRRVQIAEVLEDSGKQMLRIYPKYVIYPGVYILIVDFEASFSHTAFWGFYQTSWVDEQGWENHMVATQFSPYWARTAWPCFDEPRLKARFKFFVEHESVYDAVSNGALESRKPIKPGWVRSIFEWTPPMSTYITAMVITNYRHIESKSKSGVVTRVYGSHMKLQHSQEQLDFMTNTLDFLEEYFGVDYSLDKLYLMPLRNIAVAAMENWGLITAREDIANFNPAAHGAQWELQKRVVLAHEMAHMWFGDLVTQHWWDSIMLKESTVSWLMVYVADALYDDFDFKDEFCVLWELIRGMDKDSSVHSREMTAEAKTNDEIMGLFDAISYNRGGNIYRMVYNMVGEQPFRTAMHNYLSENAYGTAVVDDMNRYIDDAAPPEYDMVEFLDRYTKQKNFPLVHVSLLNRTHVLVRQERFLYNYKEAVNDSIYNYTWHVPFTYTTDAERNDKVVILKDIENIVELSQPATWIKANNDFRMYYITTYDLVNWKKLYHQLMQDHLQFTTTDRMQLLSDLLSLVTADRIDVTFPLEFMKYIKKEREYGPWKIATDHWNNLLSAHMSPAEQFSAKVYIRHLLDDVLSEVVLYNTSYNKPIKERLLQFLLVDAGMRADHPTANEFIDKLINSTRADDEEPGMVYLMKLRRAVTDSSYWMDLFQTLPNLTDPDDISNAYNLLCSTTNKTALAELLKTSMIASPDILRDVLSLVIEKDPVLVWNFFKYHYTEYFEIYGQSQFLMSAILQKVIEKLDKQELYAEVGQFFENNDPGTGLPGVTAGLDRINENLRWKQNHRHKCRNFFYTFAKKHKHKFN